MAWKFCLICRGDQVGPVRTLFWRELDLGPNSPEHRNTIWAVRSGPLKLVVERAEDDKPPALYNLENDIGELQNLAAVQPQDVSALTVLYGQWTLDTFPTIFLTTDDKHCYRWFWRATGTASTKTT